MSGPHSTEIHLIVFEIFNLKPQMPTSYLVHNIFVGHEHYFQEMGLKGSNLGNPLRKEVNLKEDRLESVWRADQQGGTRSEENTDTDLQFNQTRGQYNSISLISISSEARRFEYIQIDSLQASEPSFI